jgi:hypothetical protein
MSKQKQKRKNQSQAQPTPKPKAAPASSAQQQQPAPSNQRSLWVGLAIGALALLSAGLAVWLAGRSPAAVASATPAPSAVAGPIGGVTACRQQPKFTVDIGFSRSALLSTADRTVKGLILYEPQQGGAPKSYQHPTWSSAGYLGANAIDKDGNIYVAPSPRVNLIDNPPAAQNTIHKVDTNTGELTPFINLPAVRAPSLTNPYGVLGLAYDCDTHSLYATSVAGSSREEEAGRIYRIDLNTGKVASQLDDLDAIGLAVFNSPRGKRLYFGSARTQDVMSVPLDGQGNFVGAPRVEFSLEGIGPEGNDKVRKITIERSSDMVLNGTKFNYNLAPPPAQQRPTEYRYRYDPATDGWMLVDAAPNPLTG